MYRHCNQFPFDRFLKCLIDSDLTQLIISGEHSGEELANAWGEIYFEYIDLVDSAETAYIYKLQEEIALLFNEYQNVNILLYWLSPENIFLVTEDQRSDLLLLLKGYGYSTVIDFTTDYNPQLLAIHNKLALKKLRLDGKQQELDNYYEGKKNETVTYALFESVLIKLWKYFHTPIRAKDITVSEYVMMFKDYVKHYEKIPEDEIEK